MNETFHYKPDQHSQKLEQKLEFPQFFRFRQEWLRQSLGEGFNSGRVVAIVADKKNPVYSIVYYDGGRRRLDEQGNEGIVLEGVRMRTKKALRRNIQVGDLVTTSDAYANMKVIASKAQIVDKISFSPFDWDKVIGVLLWNNELF